MGFLGSPWVEENARWEVSSKSESTVRYCQAVDPLLLFRASIDGLSLLVEALPVPITHSCTRAAALPQELGRSFS